MKTIEKFVIICICSLFLCACGKQDNVKIEYYSISESEGIQSQIVSDDIQENQDKEESETPSRFETNAFISVGEIFQSVLLNEKELVCIEKEPYDQTIHIKEYSGFLNEMPNIFTEQISIVRFAVVDMDGDTMPEIVLEIENSSGYIILHYREGQIYGNFVNDKAMCFLKENGAFQTMGGVLDVGIEKLYFIGDTFVINEGARRTSVDSFYLRDIITDEGTWNQINDSFQRIREVEWHEYTEEAINEWIAENHAFIKKSENTNERQQYLDSLSYVIEMTYDLYNQSDEQFKKKAQEYYNSCTIELNRICQLCQEKLSGEEKETFQEEQYNWEDNFSQRLNEELELHGVEKIEDLLELDFFKNRYLEYGDMILRRVLELINIYYDCRYYDSLY